MLEVKTYIITNPRFSVHTPGHIDSYSTMSIWDLMVHSLDMTVWYTVS